jgi:hypothetical protein
MDEVKEIVKSSDGLTKINAYFNALNHAISTKLAGLQIDVVAISDSVILSIYLSDDSQAHKLSIFAQMCDAVSDFQCEMALKNIWMRGAITFGECYVNKNPIQIVGPAYIKAYELEQSTAIFPRVIVDPNVISELGFKTDRDLINEVLDYEVQPGITYAGKLFNWYDSRGGIKMDKDVPLFIDYLGQLFERTLYPNIHINLNLIVDHLIENLFEGSWNMGVYGKHQWTRKYLSSLCINNCVFGSNDLGSENAKINARLRNL